MSDPVIKEYKKPISKQLKMERSSFKYRLNNGTPYRRTQAKARHNRSRRHKFRDLMKVGCSSAIKMIEDGYFDIAPGPSKSTLYGAVNFTKSKPNYVTKKARDEHISFDEARKRIYEEATVVPYTTSYGQVRDLRFYQGETVYPNYKYERNTEFIEKMDRYSRFETALFRDYFDVDFTRVVDVKKERISFYERMHKLHIPEYFHIDLKTVYTTTATLKITLKPEYEDRFEIFDSHKSMIYFKLDGVSYRCKVDVDDIIRKIGKSDTITEYIRELKNKYYASTWKKHIRENIIKQLSEKLEFEHTIKYTIEKVI